MQVTVTIRNSPGRGTRLATASEVQIKKVEAYELTFNLPVGAKERFETGLERFIREETVGCITSGLTVTMVMQHLSFEAAQRVKLWAESWLRQAHVPS